MIDHVLPPIGPAIRIHAWYRSARSLLRELSRALNQGQTILRADSGLPPGSHLVLVLGAECLSAPIEVQGTVTACRRRGAGQEMVLRYEFDPEPQRRRLAEALGELRRLNRRPRREPRVPVELSTDATRLARGLVATVGELSRSGARVELAGARLPRIVPGSRLVMRLAEGRGGTATPVRLALDVRWAGPVRRSRGRRVQAFGGRFDRVGESLRRRIRAILDFEDARPRLTLTAIETRPRRRGVGRGQGLRSDRSQRSEGRLPARGSRSRRGGP